MTDRENANSEPVGPAQPGRNEHFAEGDEVAPPGVFAMSIVRWALVLAMAVAAGASLVYVYGTHGAHGDAHGTQYYCPMHPSVVQDHPGECPICSMTLVLRETGKVSMSEPAKSALRTRSEDQRASTRALPATGEHEGHRHEASDAFCCPMHPEETGMSADDRCPICKMKLVAKPTGAAQPELPTGLVPIDLPSERVQLMGMRTARVRSAKLPSTLRVVGVIAPTESALSSVQTRFSGWIQELSVSASGQAVTRGQLLARIYSPELLSAQQELLNAKQWSQGESTAAASSQATMLDNARSRLTLMGMDPAEIADVERTNTPHRLIEVRSPARGYVSEKLAVLGVFIQPGTELFRIADLSRVWVVMDVFERDASRITLGQQTTISLAAYPGEEFEGKVTFIYPILTAETRTLRARVELRNPDLRLKPGMFADVSMDVRGVDAVLIPREALADMGAHQYVFVQKEVGHFEPRAVQVGQRSDDDVQILSGLNEGETVVTTGNFLLDSESRLRATIAGSGR